MPENRTVNHMTPPPAPTDLQCLGVVQGDQISGGGGYQYHATMQWMDNATEENITFFQFTRLDGTAGTSQAAYWYDYEPEGGPVTGVKTATLIIPEGEFTCRARAVNQHVNGPGIESAYCEPIGGIVAMPPADAKPGKSQQKGNPNKP